MSIFLNSIATIATVTSIDTQPALNTLITPVTPEAFAVKVNATGNVLLQVIGSFVVPIVSIGIILSIVVYMIGAMLHAEKVRKAGAAGLGSCILGFFLYMISPYIMGLLYTIWDIFKGGSV